MAKQSRAVLFRFGGNENLAGCTLGEALLISNIHYYSSFTEKIINCKVT